MNLSAETKEIIFGCAIIAWVMLVIYGGMMPVSMDSAIGQISMDVLSEVAERVQGLHYNGGAPSAKIADNKEEPKP